MYLFHDDKQSQASPLKSGKVSSLVNNFQNVTAFQSNTMYFHAALGKLMYFHAALGNVTDGKESDVKLLNCSVGGFFSDNTGDRGLTAGIKIFCLLKIYRAFEGSVSLPWCFGRGFVHGHDWASPFKSTDPSASTLPARDLEMLPDG